MRMSCGGEIFQPLPFGDRPCSEEEEVVAVAVLVLVLGGGDRANHTVTGSCRDRDTDPGSGFEDEEESYRLSVRRNVASRNALVHSANGEPCWESGSRWVCTSLRVRWWEVVVSRGKITRLVKPGAGAVDPDPGLDEDGSGICEICGIWGGSAGLVKRGCGLVIE